MRRSADSFRWATSAIVLAALAGLVTAPTAGAASWTGARLPGAAGKVFLLGVSCPFASKCLAVDNNGDALVSTDPTGGKAAWSFTNVLPFTQAEGNALFAASCPSGSLCAATGARGQIFTSEDPFAKVGVSSDPPGHARRTKKRPRVKIARVQLPFRKEILHGNARVLIRFYARGRVRRYLCKFDQRPFSRCRSPKRYPVDVGMHVFKVRAIGVTSLKGPITREPITISPPCTPGVRGVCLRAEG